MHHEKSHAHHHCLRHRHHQPENSIWDDSEDEKLLMKDDKQEAVKMWQKVLEVDPDFLSKNEDGTEFYKQLKARGLIE